MSVTRHIAICVCGVALVGIGEASVRDVADALGERTDIAAEASSIGGTLLYPEARAGFVTLDWRSRIEPRPARYRYHGGEVT